VRWDAPLARSTRIFDLSRTENPVSVTSVRSPRAQAAAATVSARPSPPPVALQLGEPDDNASVRAAQNLRRHAWRALGRVAALVAVDAAAFIAAGLIALFSTTASVIGRPGTLAELTADERATQLALAVALFLGTTISGSYGPGDARRHTGRLCLAAAIATALPLWSRIWHAPTAETLQAGVLVFAPLFAALIGMRTAFDALAHRWLRRTGSRARAKVVLVGTAADCLARQHRTSLSHDAGFDIVGFVDIASRPDNRALGSVASLERVLIDRDVDTIVLCGLPAAHTLSSVLRAAAVAECIVLASAPQLELAAVRATVIRKRGQPLLELRPVALRAKHLFVKRALDIIGATLILILLAPLFGIIAAMVALDSPGPVFFAQRRLGRFGRPIRCLKFRSMYVDAEARLLADPVLFRRYVEHDYKLPSSIDTRITKFGRLLRRTSLDELPQLWNVLRGEMSLVGPRPIVPDEIQHYREHGPLLLSLKPGITGAWQVGGRSAVAYPQRAAVELEYVEGWSLWRDVDILLRTLPAVLASRGAH
jgi:exopolysaccharide biosynthesis polyprenyl glycosylphosphotransferase